MITKSSLLVILSLIMISLSAQQANQVGSMLMPLPQSLKAGDEKLLLTKDFKINFSGPDDQRVSNQAIQWINRLNDKTCLFITPEMDTKNTKATFQIQCSRKGALVPDEDESYQLVITNQSILLKAETDLGVLHGFETLLQLVTANEQGWYLPALEITDAPRYTWRGLMLDISRHFMPWDVIKRNIDAMAMVKLNVLHLHLSDDQGFRIESKTCPLLHEMGSNGDYYTQLEMKKIIDYAGSKGIRVVPEFDIPAHTTSWFVGYPFLASLPGTYTIEDDFGIFDPAMNPADERTYTFLDTFLTEMCSLFPDPYFHIGGDECNGNQWNNSPQVQEFIKKEGLANNHELQAYFNVKINQILLKNHKKMMGWEEIKSPRISKDIMVHAWRGEETLKEAVKEGFPVILSKGYYIDLMFPAANHYAVDPVPAGLTADEQKLIMGGEATMWSEYVTPENIDSRIWPRTAAIAERYWSPASVNQTRFMYDRLPSIELQLESLGITLEKNYEAMLRRLTQGSNIQPLKTLVDVCEPLKEYERGPNFYNTRGYNLTTASPYTRVMDVARPDARVALAFSFMVADFVAEPNKAHTDALMNMLVNWKNNHTILLPIIKKTPQLAEIESLSADLSKIADIGIQALNYINTKKVPSPDWLKQSRSQLTNARMPRGQVTLELINSIEILVSVAEKH